ncbi:MAG TPA: 2,3-dehydroadipyl-CoA hydratase [Candidatus Thioglobus sp.]|nr:2,3-dehydroadipyl-CoA hydratase [Candidatus Thioglobus sp.]
MTYKDIKVTSNEGVTLIQLARSNSLNALRNLTLEEIASVLQNSEKNDTDKCVVISGSESVFAAGADLQEMQKLSPVSSLLNIRSDYWKIIRQFSKPLLASVNGYALGAGCELMMHCDIVLVGDNVRIGQPEINLGIIPGAGGTQRLVRTVGKSLAMKMILTGEFINAEKAVESGLASEVCPGEVTLKRTLEVAKKIAEKSTLALKLAKEAILNAFEAPLELGLEHERKAFAILAASADREEGISAFLDKRTPKYI